ncbi:hypothetical protein AVEN_15186-1 [Araneus ventricosus]|uniref:Uncharacterized protein n=1 Tax=Araneus ventricosus TaxID=182803 RepID=A0A4Y2VFU1_ARAVE|nr:hypothetical protein AVEN_15186-1 [Araneus ventricosus]
MVIWNPPHRVPLSVQADGSSPIALNRYKRSVPKLLSSSSLSGRSHRDQIFTVKYLNIPVLHYFGTFQLLRRVRTSYQQIHPARIGGDRLKILNPLSKVFRTEGCAMDEPQVLGVELLPRRCRQYYDDSSNVDFCL